MRTGIRTGRPFQRRTELTSFWRARQTADLYGLPYKIFIRSAFEHLTRGGWERLPHPNQLYAKRHLEQILVASAKYWEEYKHSLFGRSFSHLPEYRAEAFCSFPAQMAHLECVADLLKARPIPWAIGQACVIDRVISPELVLAQFGEERLVRARAEVAGGTPEPIVHFGSDDLLPSCLGIPGALVPTSPECGACPTIDLCSRIQALTLAMMKRKTGSETPVDERRKKLGRERTRRCRERKTLAATVSLATIEASSSAGSNHRLGNVLQSK